MPKAQDAQAKEAKMVAKIEGFSQEEVTFVVKALRMTCPILANSLAAAARLWRAERTEFLHRFICAGLSEAYARGCERY